MTASDPYYGADLTLVHHLGFGFHADRCAPGILRLLEPILAEGGTVLELGCGSGLLTRYLVDAGHRVIATDASPAMLDLARAYAPGAEDVRQLRLPDDPLPQAEAVVSIGHVLSYLADEESITAALVAVAGALRPGGIMAIDLLDFEYARTGEELAPSVRRSDNWCIVTEYERPEPNRFVRDMTTFVRNDDGTWRRSDERHLNVLIDVRAVPQLLAGHGIAATTSWSFGSEQMPQGLGVVVGRRPS